MIKKIIVLVLLLFNFAGKAQKVTDTGFTAYSPAFVDNGAYPKLYTCDSLALSPPISWRNVPKGTKSIAITMHHIPRDGDKHVYMVLYNIPVSVSGIPQANNNIGVWGGNTINRVLGYAPPCSKGPGEKAYVITVYALADDVKYTGEGLAMDGMLQIVNGKILATSTLTVKYAR